MFFTEEQVLAAVVQQSFTFQQSFSEKLMLEEHNQLMGREGASWTSFSLVVHITIRITASKYSPPVRQRAHVATKRTGILDKIVRGACGLCSLQ